MKLTCDLCGSELQMNPGGAVCTNCGLEYGEDRLREKIAEQKPVPTPQPSVPEKPAATNQKAKKNVNPMWIILALIGIAAFLGGLLESGIIYLVCLVATLITLLIFKPWKVYGGKP